LPHGTDGAKVGLDDFLLGHTAADVLALAEDELRPPPADAAREGERIVGSYKETPSGIVHLRDTREGRVETPLTNFAARLVGNVAEDDGAEVRRILEVRAVLKGRALTARLTPEKFVGMGWPIELLGASALVYPGQSAKDHTRAAIQILSEDVPERVIYAHTGWREHEGGWAYLHAGGAIGARGAVPNVEVALPGDLARITLPEPPTGEALIAAIRASLNVASVAPEALTLPLLAATYRAALGGTDFSLFLVGPTGIGKSELAALAQQHYGATLDARHLPASWSSTANALEGLLFAGKDSLVCVDDFAPGGNQADVQRMHRDAERVLRGQGNHAGRQRMTADARLRVAKPSRATPLITGEDIPRGQSARARALILEVGAGRAPLAASRGCPAPGGGRRLRRGHVRVPPLGRRAVRHRAGDLGDGNPAAARAGRRVRRAPAHAGDRGEPRRGVAALPRLRPGVRRDHRRERRGGVAALLAGAGAGGGGAGAAPGGERADRALPRTARVGARQRQTLPHRMPHWG